MVETTLRLPSPLWCAPLHPQLIRTIFSEEHHVCVPRSTDFQVDEPSIERSRRHFGHDTRKNVGVTVNFQHVRSLRTCASTGSPVSPT